LEWLNNGFYPDWLLLFDGVVPKGAGGMAIPGSISTSAVGREETVLTDLWNYDPPKVSRGKMLVTAQELDLSHASRIRMTSIVIPSWTIKEAKALLRSKVPMDKWEDSFAVGVVELLELHPLAIIHAASYVTRNAYNTEQYPKEMRSLDMIKARPSKEPLVKFVAENPSRIGHFDEYQFRANQKGKAARH
jgi:hypothetical protein